MHPLRAAAPFLLALLIGLSGVLAGVPPARAAGDVGHRASSVYRLDVKNGQIKVTADIVVTNRIANTVEYVPCIDYSWDPYWGYTPYSSTCPSTTRYYVNEASTFVESEARNIRVTAGGASISTKKAAKGEYYRRLDFKFSKIWNGQSRRIRVTYTIPGGKPRSASTTRAMRAYTNFCATAHGYDSATVEIRVPKGFEMVTRGSKLSSRVSGKERIYKSGTVGDPASWIACLEGSNESGYKTTTVAAPNGREVVLKAWPEDPAWAEAVGASIASGLSELTELLGTDMSATKPLLVKESVTGSEYAGWYSEDSNTITVDEDFRQEALVEHELAHVWLNGATFEDTWLIEGTAEWAARQVSDTDACRKPSGAAAKLSEWAYITPKATDAERAAVDSQYDASCWVVTSIANAAGQGRLTAALATVMGGIDPYAATADATAVTSTSPAATKAASWKRWLDAVDEVALEPAGASPDLASDLLLEFGATSDRTLLDARAAARAGYHDLAGVVDWTVPAAVRAPLAAWDFTKAQAALDAALPAWSLTGETDGVLPGVDAREGPAADAWAAARTASDLVAAGVLAQAQLDAATDVATTMAVADAPRDFVQVVGLLGTTVPSIDPAVAAVREIDTETAAAVSASIRQTLVEATSAGQLRIGLAVAITAAMLLLIAFLVWRRARRRRVLATAVVMPAPEAFADAPTEVLGMASPNEPSLEAGLDAALAPPPES